MARAERCGEGGGQRALAAAVQALDHHRATPREGPGPPSRPPRAFRRARTRVAFGAPITGRRGDGAGITTNSSKGGLNPRVRSA